MTTTTLSLRAQWQAGGAALQAAAKWSAGVSPVPERFNSTSAPTGVSAVPPELRSTSGPRQSSVTPYPCGGEYPPCYVALRESGNRYDAFNPNGCGGHACFGRWQFSGAWAGKLGLPLNLSTATPAQQDAAARELWAGGAGCSHWAAC